jgi:hypothetical protein
LEDREENKKEEKEEIDCVGCLWISGLLFRLDISDGRRM